MRDLWEDFIRPGLMMIFAGAILVSIFFWTAMACIWTVSGFEYATWNKLHDTNYTQYEWFTGSDFIKKYHYPNRSETVKHELNLNTN